ncbi:MAG: glycosyltransferase [Gammaproteobacteria bacterium]|nr:glycosyltransferase [Gammaproteobacteria bacterium]
MTHARPKLAMIGFRSGAGGIGRVMTTLINGLLARSIAVDLLIPSKDHPDLEAIDDKVGLFEIDVADQAAASRLLKGYLEDNSPQAILSNKDQSNLLLKRNLIGAGRPLTAFRVGINVPEKLRHNSPLTAYWKQRRLKRLYLDADILIGNSSGVSNALGRMLGGNRTRVTARPKITTIWNPVDQERITQMAAESTSHPWLTEKHQPIIVAVGRLVRQKNHALLLRSFARLTRNIDARLIICGTGRKRDRLSGLSQQLGIADRVDLVGYQKNPFPYIAAADLFVCSSRFEGSNNALMEALTLGTPCVSTDCPSGARDILDNGELGALVPINDPNALAAAMQSMLQRPTDPQRLRAGAERFNAEASAAHYADVLGLRAP